MWLPTGAADKGKGGVVLLKRLKEGVTRLLWRARGHLKPRGARFLKWVSGVLLGLYVLYVAAATAFIHFGGMTSLTRTEKDVRIDVASGYSLFPGRLHLRGLRVQFKDYNVEMAIFAEEAHLSLALHRLLQKRIHVYWVRASGVEYQMLHRVKDPKESAARLAAFPDLPAFDRPAYYDAPRPPRSTKKPWSLRVDSIDAEARFAWILEYQLRGKMRAKGAFYTDPLHEAAVLPCEVVIHDATISVGEEQIAHDVRGTLAFELAPFTVRDAPFNEVLPKISSRVGDFTARMDTLSFTSLYFSTDPMSLEGRGELEIDTTVIDGKIQQGSIASLALSPLVISAQGREETNNDAESARGNGRISLEAQPRGHLIVAAQAEVPPTKEGPFSLQALSAKAEFWHSDLTAFELRGLQIDVESLQYGTPEFLYALFGWHAAIPMSGKFHLHGQADLPEKGPAELKGKLETLSTSFYFEGQRFGVTSETTMNCRGTLKTADCGVDFHAPYLLLDRQSDGTSEATWLRLETPKPLQVSAEGGTFHGSFVVSGGDPKDALSEWMGKSWLPQMGLSLVPTGPITGSFIVRRAPGQFSLSNIDVATGKTRLEGEVTSGAITSAVGTLAMPVGRWGFESNPAGLRIRPFIGRKWLGKQEDQVD